MMVSLFHDLEWIFCSSNDSFLLINSNRKCDCRNSGANVAQVLFPEIRL